MNREYKPISNLWQDLKGYRYFGTLKLSSKIKYDGDDFIPLWEWVKQLQQENERLKENNMSYQEEMAKTWKIADDYKSRFEKATKYIKEKQKNQYKFALSHIECDDLLQILEDKEVQE